MNRSNPVAALLVLVFLLLMLAGLGVRFWAVQKSYSFSGPTHLATNSNALHVFAGGSIFSLDASGSLLGETPLERTGLADDPIEMRGLSTGELLVAGQQPADIRICEPENWHCRALNLPGLSGIERQFKMLPDSTGDSYLLSDARGDMLWRLPPTGERSTLVNRWLLAGPNDLAFDASGALWVADTDHRRLVELLPTVDGGFEPGRELHAENHLTIGSRFYPMMLTVAPDGKLWVAQAAEFSQARADLLVYDPTEGAEARVTLPEGAYPTDVVLFGDSIIVSDMDRNALYSVNRETLTASPFGGPRLQARLAEFDRLTEQYRRLSTWSLVAIILGSVLMVGALVLTTPRGKRWTQAEPRLDFSRAPESVPPLHGTHWLDVRRSSQRMINWMEYVFYGALAALGIVCLSLYALISGSGHVDVARQLGIVFLVGGAVLLSLLPMVWFSARTMKRRLGTDGKRMYLRLADGRELAIEPKQAVYNDRVILYRNFTVPLQLGVLKSLYTAEEMETWLGPMLRQSRRVSEWEVLRHQWRHRDPLLMWSLGSFLVIGLLLGLWEVVF